MNTGGDFLSKYETAPYKVLEKEGPFEIRQYDAFYTVAVEEDTLEGSSGFSQIFDYISGNNEDQTKISMTTPVVNEMKKKRSPRNSSCHRSIQKMLRRSRPVPG